MCNRVVRWLALVLLTAPLYANDIYTVYYVGRGGLAPTNVQTAPTTTVSQPVTTVNTSSPYYGFSNTGSTSQYAGNYTTVSNTTSSPSVYYAVVNRYGASTQSYVPQYSSTAPVQTSTPTTSTTWTSPTQTYVSGSYGGVIYAGRGSGLTYTYQQTAIPNVSPLNAQPEPGTIAMLAGGLALLGVMARRRKQ